MAKKTLIEAIHFKEEVTYDTDPVPTSVDSVQFFRGTREIVMGGQSLEFDTASPSIDRAKAFPVGTYSILRFDIPCIGGGTAVDTPPAYNSILLACGTAETITASTEVDYDPISTAMGSGTAYVNVDGELETMTGCRGTMSLRWTIDQFPVWSVELWGKYIAPTSAAAIATDLTLWEAATVYAVDETNWTVFSIHGQALEPREFTFDQAHNIVRHRTGGATPANETIITRGAATGSVSYQKLANSVWEPKAIALAGTQGAFLTTLGTAGGSIVEVSGAQVQIGQPTTENVNDIEFWRHEIIFAKSSAGNDSYQFTTR